MKAPRVDFVDAKSPHLEATVLDQENALVRDRL